ncbi:MAG: hypothetical protein E5V91_22320 [Mesorhizobium sp.]|nr:hypothetical protein EJ068_16365 [Mesorhizobium sp. M2A.F.Ca.ET.043.02.1.1]RUW42436.1 hypothetical protein EOA37_04960 [Mesorhizobium sp. M2A.F.Ca.ET.015.02.1.1]RUW80054.1 hypothetical protein EOA28_06145 [Mesorhizobium sp. M2A.F.Ca.ET.067.02.1.1]RVC91090.1 hypothetical protein EN739_31085 [Mesorhizobium sp. M2A.F.Ca.ET.017.03.2.1]RWB45329.1 MAG: hypothetical protein EOQ46_10955 [Mesorhizobium sp.]
MTRRLQKEKARRRGLHRFTETANPPWLSMLAQFRTENRFALFLELRWPSTGGEDARGSDYSAASCRRGAAPRMAAST